MDASDGARKTNNLPSDKELETQLAFVDYGIDRTDERVIGPDGPLKLGTRPRVRCRSRPGR